MRINLPALDEANHAGTRKLPAVAAAIALVGFVALLINLDVLPLPKGTMTAGLAAYAAMIALTTLAYHRWGFHSNRYRVMLLLETQVLLAVFAFAMAENPPGLPILWAFYLLLTVITAQDVGASPLALGVVLSPITALFAYKLSSDAAFDLRHYSYVISCGLLSAGLFLLFGKNKESQLALAAHQVDTERALTAAQARLEAEQRLRALDEHWLGVMAKVSSALLLVDENLHVVERRAGSSNSLHIEPESIAEFLFGLRAQFNAASRTPEPVAQFGVALPRAGGHADVRIVALPAGSRVERFAVLIQDATERMAVEAENRRLMEQMIVTDKLQSVGLLAAGIAHEVGNPLSYVLGNVEHLRESCQFGPKAAEALEDTEKGLRQIAEIIADLRGFSYSSGISYRQTVDLRQVIRRAQRLVSGEIRQYAQLTIELPDEPVYVRCQSERIQQVVVNLLMNAMQALCERPMTESRITLALAKVGDTAEVCVRDNGIGISPETQEKIFDLFYTTKPAGKGTGLGLSIAYRIAKEHGGALVVHSQLGKGSAFVLRLPLVATLAADELRVLMIDDEESALTMYARALEKFHVTAAASVTAAKALLGNDYDAVLCDLRLHDGSGLEVYQSAPQKLRARFAFYTALPLGDMELRQIPDDVPVFQKPLGLDELEQVIQRLAQRSSV